MANSSFEQSTTEDEHIGGRAQEGHGLKGARFSGITHSYNAPIGHRPGEIAGHEESLAEYSAEFVETQIRPALKFGNILNDGDRADCNSYWGYDGNAGPADGSYPAPNFENISNINPDQPFSDLSTWNQLPSPYMPNLIPPDIHNPTETQQEFYITPAGAASRNDDGTAVEDFRPDNMGSKLNPSETSFTNREKPEVLPPVDRVYTQDAD